MFDIEKWLVIERHLLRFPGGISLCERVRKGEAPWPAIGEELINCTWFPTAEFRHLLASGDFDVRWPLTFTVWYRAASGASVDQACMDFLTESNLWNEALKAFPEYNAFGRLYAFKQYIQTRGVVSLDGIPTTYDDVLMKFGLPAPPLFRDEIRRLLTEEIERERQGVSGEEMLRTFCLLLFSMGVAEDTLLIWEAKQSSFDASIEIDVQFLCGAGLAATKDCLVKSSEPSAAVALDYLTECEQSGDFADWTPQTTLAIYRSYYGLE